MPPAGGRRAVRLSDVERQAVVGSFLAQFPDAERIVLFGSRADDSKRGGDIDILVVCAMDFDEAFRASLRAKSAAHIALGGERKIDVVVSSGNGDDRLVVEEALRTGIELWKK